MLFDPRQDRLLFGSGWLRTLFGRHLARGELLVNHRPQMAIADLKALKLIELKLWRLLLRSVVGVAMALEEGGNNRPERVVGRRQGAGIDQGKEEWGEQARAPAHVGRRGIKIARQLYAGSGGPLACDSGHGSLIA